MVDQRQVLQLEVEKGDNIFTFNIPVGTPLQDAYAAMIDMMLTIKKTLDDHVAKQVLELSKKEVGSDDEKVENDNGIEFKTDTDEIEDD